MIRHSCYHYNVLQYSKLVQLTIAINARYIDQGKLTEIPKMKNIPYLFSVLFVFALLQLSSKSNFNNLHWMYINHLNNLKLKSWKIQKMILKS